MNQSEFVTKTGNWRQARETCATGAKRGKMCVNQVTIRVLFWLVEACSTICLNQSQKLENCTVDPRQIHLYVRQSNKKPWKLDFEWFFVTQTVFSWWSSCDRSWTVFIFLVHCYSLLFSFIDTDLAIVYLLGLFHIVRLPRLNSLVCHVPDSFDLAFKLRRKKMTIEVSFWLPNLFVNFGFLAGCYKELRYYMV